MKVPILQVAGLNVWFEGHGGPIHAVRGIDLQLEAGDSLGFIGESGCGKTTTALAILGLLPPNAVVSGQILFDGQDILARGEETIRPHRWIDIAIVFQGAMNALNPVRTVGRQLIELMEYHQVAAGKAAMSRLNYLLTQVGLRQSVASSYPHELSGGMRQRAAIALALSCRPKILIADEPTTAIDVIAQAQVLRQLREATSDERVALLFISHDLSVVAQMCKAAAVMYAGRIVESAPIGPLLEAPRHPYTAALIAASPDLESPAGRAMVSLPDAPPRLDREILGCSFAPRCPSRFGPCTASSPSLIEVGAGRHAACFLNQMPMAAAKP